MDGDPKQPAAEIAYRAVRAQIMSGTLKGGARLKEQSLASALGLSRTPVREAIGRLVMEGFAERGEGYSTRVAQFPEDELDHVFEIRRRLEALAAERAATRATPAQIAELDRLTRQMETLPPPRSEQDYLQISDINTAFHRIISEAAHATRLMAVLSLAVDVGLVSRTYHSYSEQDLIRSTRHHRELVDALRARAPAWAASVMSSHVLAAAASATGSREDWHGSAS